MLKSKQLIILCFMLALSACGKPKLIKDADKNIAKDSDKSTAKNTDKTAKQNNGIRIADVTQNDASKFLNFAETYSNCSPDLQKQMLYSTNQKLNINPNDLMQRMQLVMINGLASSSIQDSAKAQYLLQQILQEDILSGDQLAFANMLFDFIVAHNKHLKNTRPDDKQDDKRLEMLQQKNETLQLKLEATQQKLEELKKIEKTMGERETQSKQLNFKSK